MKIEHARRMSKNGWDCDQWVIHVGEHVFSYHTGIRHRKDGQPVTPLEADVLYALSLDAQWGAMTFAEFVSDFGPENAKKTHRACVENHRKMSALYAPEELASFLEAGN